MIEPEEPVRLPIQAVVRETGLSKELLRMWERRYGFPDPQRDAQGDRLYDMDQVVRLRLLKRLVDQGFRPSKIIHEPQAQLLRLMAETAPRRASEPTLADDLLAMLQHQDVQAIRDFIAHQLISLGIERFVLDFMQQAHEQVGEAWMRGALAVHDEHLFTAEVQAALRLAISNLRLSSRAPRALLATPPDETHTLGLLMVEALMRVEGLEVLSYGAQMPVRDVAQAVKRHQVPLVGISVSAAYSTARALEFLELLRLQLPSEVVIWAGGSALRGLRQAPAGVVIHHSLHQLREAIQAWRTQHTATIGS